MTTAEQEWRARHESRHTDKAEWYRGQWDDEPDRIEWRYHGTPRFPLLINRGPSGALCGYVGVPPGHPLHGVDYADIDGLRVHGGLTYADKCQESARICHVPRVGESPDVWWLGFDCAHCYDYSGMARKWIDDKYHDSLPHEAPNPHETYRDVWWVRAEVESLADQLARVAKGLPADDDEDREESTP